ncbi:bifunctional glycoside hydrolase 114/ polysaccharide deacetylase family protein [Sulfurihydrogenibium azorense]|uniref:bifunctional glycoside hydrolase 114/ polysaccharide deacetylase family protein n=1 Tax=Sulfurihydrogenibium azorense TaxID=309806 RepID=UPI002408F9DE|nr:endo alpha-1,4 polygalactosaminidase [Sulfurihydrogenibium azorense]MDM7274174.1 endo alpha-1,4 polygalactosaminidase [Sulfurihydrogenibium azorense]
MRFIIGLLCLFSFYMGLFSKSYGKDIAVGFIYREPPEEAFYLYDWLVVDPDNFSWEKFDEKFYIKNRKAKLIAYVSLGEIEPYRSYYKEIKKDWILGENKAWKTYIADIRNKEYQKFLIEKVIKNLDRFDGIFFDTLDSYQQVLKPQEFKSYEDSMIDFLKEIRKKYSNKTILVNRGFEIADKVVGIVDGFVAESLFYGIDVKSMKYKKMSKEDTQWLLDKLSQIKNLGFIVIVIDYVDPKNKKLAKEVAQKIYQLGFIPYVADKNLQTVGTSIYQLIPRKVLMFYDSKENDVAYSTIHRLYQLYVEYLGYIPVLQDIQKGLPDRFLADEYAGVLIRLSKVENEKRFIDWVKKQIDDGIKVFFLDYFPVSEDLLSLLGINYYGIKSTFDKADILEKRYNYFEIEPDFDSIPLVNVKEGNPVLTIKVNSKAFVPFAITKWGGYALERSFLRIFGENELFVFDPVKVFRDIFNPDFPALDITTENGRRILTAHIDGDAFFGVADFEPSKTVGEIIRDKIIKKSNIPHTVSIIEGEISLEGLYPERSKYLEEVARSIFELDNVEIASHSFSHPFKWRKIEELSRNKNNTEGYNLPIKGYTFSLEREIIGSVNYINEKLAPKDKKVKVFLWTGDCVPSEEAIKLTYKLGIYNTNGGDTVIDSKNPFFSYIGPMGLNRDEYFQIYAPIQNENIYTDLWKDYYGYINVISTYKLTDKPYRFKPISIYYHFYSGQKLSSLKALDEVYSYALSQEVNPMFLSEYDQRVLEFRNTAICRDIRDDSIIIRGEGNLRTVRLDKDVKVDIFNSKGVVGFKKINDSTYIHLDNSGDYKLSYSDTLPNFYLIDSNGQIEDFKVEADKVKIRLKSYLPLEFRIFNRNCKVSIEPKNYSLESGAKHIHEYRFKREKEAYVEAYCN